MNRWANKVAFVTGSSSGIGEAIAEKLVNEGLKVVGVARRKERLDELAKRVSSQKGKFYPFQADVSKEEEIINAFKWTFENVGPVSILINNAGISKKALLSESATSNWVDVLNVNVLGPCIATREAIKQMKENNIDGHIIYVNSVAGHKIVPLPNLNMYSPSKHAITAIATTLRLELATHQSKIKVTSLSPGLVRTEINDKNLLMVSAEEAEILKKRPCLESEDIANGVIFVLSTPKHVQISELTIQPLGELV